MSDFSNGYYNIVGCKGKTPGSPVNLGVNGGGTVLAVNGSATVSLRAITITGDTNAASGVVSVLGGTFILKDKVNITGNTYASGNARNISLGSGQKINVDADGLAGTKVGISAVDVPTTGNPVVFTSGYAASASAADLPYAHFTSDSGYAAILSEATATLGEAAFAVGGGSIDIGEIYSVDFEEDAASSVGSLHVYKAVATSSSGTTDITSEITSWSMKLYCLNSYTGTTFDTNEADLFGFDEATYVLKINAVYGGNTYSSEIEIKHLASEFSTNAATLYSASADMTNNIHAKVENVAGGIKFTISRPHETWYEPSAGGGIGVITIYRQEVGGATSLRCEYSPDPSATTAEVFWPLCDMGARYVYDVQIEPINPRSYREYIRHEMLSITPDDGGGEENITYSGGTLSATASFVAEMPKVVIANPPTIVTPDPRVESYQMEVHYNAGQDWGQPDTEWMTYYICAPTSLVHIDPYDGTGTDFRTMLASFEHDRFFIQVKFVFTLSSCPGQKWAHKVVDSNYVVMGAAGSAVTLATPLTLEAAVAGAVVTFSNKASGPVTYKKSDGTEDTIASNDSKAITLSAVGDTVEFYGDNAAYATSTVTSACSNIACSADCYVYGNIMSLVKSAGFESETALIDAYTFCRLFKDNAHIKNKTGDDLLLPATTMTEYCYHSMFHGCTSLTTAPELPSTTLSRYCYHSMFYGCTSLTAAPALPATTLANFCYDAMFDRCTSLTAAPELPATTLATYCYESMFLGCTSLMTAPALPATTMKDYCYESMFYGCTSLTAAPELPATTLANHCYYSMFDGCSSLTAAPVLPATTLSINCYAGMFRNCTSLTTAPELPATTLEAFCYQNMFEGCSSLTSAPSLPATTLTESCYNGMFSGCTSLNSVTCLATDISTYICTTGWLNGVASSGTFTKAAGVDWSSKTGADGIPSGWTVQTAP